MYKLGDVLSKVVQLKCITDEGLGAEPPAARGHVGLRAPPPTAGRFFCNFLEKLAILMPLDHNLHQFRII